VLRTRHGLKLNADGTLAGKRPKETTTTKWLLIPNRLDERNQFVRFLDETHNEKDEFIRTFVDNPNVFKDPAFLKTLQAVRVRYCHSFFISMYFEIQ
jgi:hypothetical protein